jgi:hypothetical protein
MYGDINRFLGHPDQVQNFNGFFGTGEWESCKELTDAAERNRCLHDLYMKQMREAAGIEYVRSFEMSNDKDVTDYFLFYGTSQYLGLKKMKEAMWKVDESGEFSFSDATNPNQMVLFAKEPNLAHLKKNLVDRFKGQDVLVEEIERFVVVETAFRETHYKGLLKAMEKDTGEIEAVNAPASRRSGTFGDPKMIVRFKS